MTTNMSKSSKFYCPWCKITFSCILDNGVAKCPICKFKRDDGFNQISRMHFQCTHCGCRLGGIPKDGLVCPNGCKKEGLR